MSSARPLDLSLRDSLEEALEAASGGYIPGTRIGRMAAKEASACWRNPFAATFRMGLGQSHTVGNLADAAAAWAGRHGRSPAEKLHLETEFLRAADPMQRFVLAHRRRAMASLNLAYPLIVLSGGLLGWVVVPLLLIRHRLAASAANQGRRP